MLIVHGKHAEQLRQTWCTFQQNTQETSSFLNSSLLLYGEFVVFT